jgi:hypothetical protein
LPNASGEHLFLGAGPYVEALDPATGATLKRFFIADPVQSLRIEGGELRVQTTAGGNVRLSLHTAFLPIPPSPDPAMTGFLLARAVHCMPGIPAETLSDLRGKCPQAVRIAHNNPSCIPIYEKESRLDPGNPFLHFFLGLAWKGQGLETEMKTAFERAESVPDLPFFEYAALGNLFELSYLPDHADLCYARTLKAFRSQIPLSPIEYCPEELHRAFFPADVDAGGMHVSQGNIVRYMKQRNIRRQMFLHSDGDFLDTLRALNLRDDPRLKSVVESESAYFATLKQDPFLRENHLLGLDADFLLVKVLTWSSPVARSSSWPLPSSVSSSSPSSSCS